MLLQYPKYNQRGEADNLYEEIHDFIVLHLGNNGGSCLAALRLCLGLHRDFNSPLLLNDLYSIRDHLDVRTLQLPAVSDEGERQAVKEAVLACRRPCFSFSFTSDAEWQSFQKLFRGPHKATTVFSRRLALRLPQQQQQAHALAVGHAVNLRSYDAIRDCFQLVNSWGSDWGDDGRFCVAAEDLLVAQGQWPTAGEGGFATSSVTDVNFRDSLPAELRANVRAYQCRHGTVVHARICTYQRGFASFSGRARRAAAIHF